jgi:hypothetical protein
MIESMTTVGAAVSELTSDRVTSCETAATDRVDRCRIVPERQVDRRSAPYTGDDSSSEDGSAKVDAIVIAVADGEARIPGFAPAQRNPAHRIHDADDF